MEILPEGSGIGCNLSVPLRKLITTTTGIVNKMFAASMSLSPHSIKTGRIFSHHNIVASDSRISMTDAAINSRLFIALNGIAAAHYDPRAAVAYFLAAKERRKREPDFEIYRRQQFIKKCFRKEDTFRPYPSVAGYL